MQIKVLDAELYSEELLVGFSPKLEGDIGLDLRSAVDVTIQHGETETVPLGVSVAIPPGHVGWLTGRSATSLKFGLIAHEGKIDPGYRGEIHAFLTAQGEPVKIERGDRVCQLVVMPVLDPLGWEVVEDLLPTQRGERGLGSTGRR